MMMEEINNIPEKEKENRSKKEAERGQVKKRGNKT